MALKISNTPVKKQTKLPPGADRFLWTEVPVPVTKTDYAQILRLDKRD